MLEQTTENSPLPPTDEEIKATETLSELQAYMNNLDLFINTSQQILLLTTQLQNLVNLDITQEPLSNNEVRDLEKTFNKINNNIQVPKIIREQSLKHIKLLIHLNIILHFIDSNYQFLKEFGPEKTRVELTKKIFNDSKKEVEKQESIPKSYTQRYKALINMIEQEEEKLNIAEQLRNSQQGDIIFDSNGNRYFILTVVHNGDERTLSSEINCLKIDSNNNTSNIILETRGKLDSNQKSQLSVRNRKENAFLNVSKIIRPEKPKNTPNPLALADLDVGDLILNPSSNNIRLITNKTRQGLTLNKYNASNGNLEKTKEGIQGFRSDELIVIKK